MRQLLPTLPTDVAYEKADASGCYRPEVYRDPSVRMVLRTAVADYERSGDYRPHLAVLENREPTPPKLTRDEWAKATPGPCFGAYPRMRPWLHEQWPADSSRKLDVFFAGSVDPYPKPIWRHRIAMLNVPVATIYTGRPLNPTAYRGAMLHAKVALCPWGNGEMSYRLYEAMHAGCVPVMPRTDWLTLWWGRPTDGVQYVGCKRDGSDVAEVCASVLDRWDDYAGMRERNRQLARLLLAPEVLAKWKDEVLR